MNLQQWTGVVTAELDIDVDLDVRAILDAARDVAHSVERPAAPLTTFLIGYAAAARGGTAKDVRDVIAQVLALAPADEA